MRASPGAPVGERHHRDLLGFGAVGGAPPGDDRDRGAAVGVPHLPHRAARLLEPFFTTKPPGRGMGLGFFLARTFAERWHGSLTLQSDPGRGTRAVLALPLATEARADVA